MSKIGICPKCNDLLFTNIQKRSNIQIHCLCSCSYKNEFEDIKQYFSSFLIKEYKMDGSCTIHKNEKNNFYCFKCKEQVCQYCKNYHKGHKIVYLKDYLSENELQKIINNYNSSKNKISILNTRIKDEILNYLDKQKFRIESSYKQNKEINELLLQYFETILNNYNQIAKKDMYNYKIITNLLSNSSFNLSAFKPKDEIDYKLNPQNYIDEIIDYYDKDFILKESEIKFKKHFKIELSSMTEVKTIRDYTGYIYSIIVLKDGKLASSTYNDLINIYDSKSFNLIGSLEGHSGAVWSLCQLETSNYLVSSSSDCNIIIWDISGNEDNSPDSFSYECITVLKGHKFNVTKVVEISQGRIASCSDDKCIKIWNTEEGKYFCLWTFNENTDYISSIFYSKNFNKLISGSYKKEQLLFWNVDKENYFLENRIVGVGTWSQNSICECPWDKDKLIIGGKNIICIVNMITYQVETRICNKYMGNVNSLLVLNDGTFLSGHYAKIIQWNQLLECLYIKKDTHEDFINCLAINKDGLIFTCSYDETIKIMKP